MSSPTVSREFTQAIFDYLTELGHPADDVLHAANIPSAALLALDRVPLLFYERLFSAGELLTGDRCFGLSMGAQPYPLSWGLVSHLAASAPDAMAAASALLNYSELQLNFIHFVLRDVDSGYRCLEIQHEGKLNLERHVVEHLLANIVVLASTQIGYAVPILEIELAHNNTYSATQFASLSKAKVSLNSDAYRVRVAPEFLNQQAVHGEEDLYRVTQELAQQRLMKLRGEDRFLNIVRMAVQQQLHEGLPKVAQVASRLDISARTLQRRLGERNLNYQKVLDEVRGELALTLIREGSMSFNDIALHLGFNDQSAFQNAFRRWQGVSPGRYRRQLRTSSGNEIRQQSR